MRSEETLSALIEALEGNCGDFYGACKECRVSPAFVRTWMKDDPKIAEALDCAKQVGAMRLESAAISRAVKGVKEDVYYQGEVVGKKRVYSDGLLQFLMKGRLKETYGADAGASVNLNLTNAIQIMPRATTYEEWLQMAAMPQQAQLPAPEQVEEAEFSVVLPPPELDPAMADIL